MVISYCRSPGIGLVFDVYLIIPMSLHLEKDPFSMMD